MDYNLLLDFATDLGYRLAMSGAETFRVEESINRIMDAYGIQGEVFAIPNCITVSIEADHNRPITRMRRIGYHGNDLDAVEGYSNLSRLVCQVIPKPETAMQWLRDADRGRRYYPTYLFLLGNYIAAFGFTMFFGGTLKDSLLGGVCGLVVGLVDKLMNSLKANGFFRTIAAAFLMALPAYFLCNTPLLDNADAAIIGALMLLVPGLLFTNAMRDIIYGDTNSGVIRIVQVFLIAAALALGTGAALKFSASLWGAPVGSGLMPYGPLVLNIACLIGCTGFAILFNIHGPGVLLCVIGGILSWSVYLLVMHISGNDITAYFWASAAAAVYAEVLARIRKYPAISYLVVSIFPLIPGAWVYYTMDSVVRGDMIGFSEKGTHTIAIAGIMAVGILLISTSFRLWSNFRGRLRARRKRK